MRGSTSAGGAVLGGLRAAVRWARGGARRAHGGARTVGRAARRATHASGAGRSGLANLIELHTVNHAGDVLVAIGLAGTLFFGLPVDEARGQVALYLLVTMAPFAVVAPLVGPALDRVRAGRRYALAGTMLARGLLCWAMASAVVSQDTVTLFPAAFGVLVLTKAYNISRIAVAPRLLPAEISLVTANARMTLAGTVGAGIAGAAGVGLASLAGPAWVLRVTTVLFLAGTVLAVRLPSRVESAGIDVAATGTAARADSARPPRKGSMFREAMQARLGPVVTEGLRANAAVRALGGFLILFFAFLVRTAGFPGVPEAVTMGMLLVLAGAGGFIGTGIGAWARQRVPEVLVLSTLALATAVTAVGAWLYGLVAVAVIALVVGLAQALGKLGLDALIQRDVREEVRSSAFARSETVLQLAQVVGGGAGLAVSFVPNGTLGLALAAAALACVLAVVTVSRVRRTAQSAVSRPEPASAGNPAGDQHQRGQAGQGRSLR